jgi:hypothetical protein
MIDVLVQSAIRNLQSAILGVVSYSDAFAAVIILAGVLCHFLHRRMPPGLGTSLFVWAATVGAVTAAYGHDWPAPGKVYWPAPGATYTASGITSVLCALWAFFGYLASRRAGNEPPSRVPDRQSSTVNLQSNALPFGSRLNNQSSIVNRQPSTVPTPSATFFAWSLVTGIAVVVVTAYVLIYATSWRLLDPDRISERLPAAGLWNIIGLLTATLFWAATVARRQQPVVSLILAALLAWWTSLMIPSAVGTYESTSKVLLPFQPEWWTWTFQMQFGLTALLLIAAVLQERRYRSRRRRAWPDRLDDLLEPYSRWPAFTQTEAVIAAVILVLGVFQVVRSGPPSWQLAIASCVISLVAGITCLFMTYRRWSVNTAGLGMALLTLSAVALACAVTSMYGAAAGWTAYAARLPVVYNAILFAMAVMIALWSWLARFWDQQLLDGVPWTTAGRMIPHALRAAYLLTALAVLVAYQMVLWPRRGSFIVEDNTPGRLVAGLLALFLLALITARNARRSDSSAVATLGVTFVIAAVIFVFLRMPASAFHGWLRQYDAVVFSSAAVPILLAADWLPRTRWRCFSLPLWWLALLVLPGGALLELHSSRRLPADWVQPLTFAVLGSLYILAGLREHRRAILVLGGVLLAVAGWALYHT